MFLMLFRSVAKRIKVLIRSSFMLLMLTGSVAKMNKSFFFSLFVFFVPLLNPLLLAFHLYFLLSSILPFSRFPPPLLTSHLCVPFLLVPEMDMGLPGEGDSSINALCCQINSSFTKPSDELFSDPSLSVNGPPTCTVPPILPPPPAPMQGKHQINSNIDFW